MDNYVINALFRLAILFLLTSIGAVDIYIKYTADYDGVMVLLLHQRICRCYRHQPTEGAVVTRVLIGGAQDPSFVTSSPYLDVLIDGIRKYFKVENSNWSSSTPFRGNKYNYYKVKNSEVFPCDGLEYVEIYRASFRRDIVLSLWRNQRLIDSYKVAGGRISAPKKHYNIKRVVIENITLWEYDQEKGIALVKAMQRKMHRRAVAILCFKDLNDNTINLNYMLWRHDASYLSPWKGSPKKYDAPPERLPCPSVQPRLEPIPLIINLTSDIADTPLLKVRNHNQGERSVCVYISHPNAYIKRSISPHFKRTFQNDNIFVVTYARSRGNFQIQALSYEGVTTKLLIVNNENLKEGLIPVADPKVIVYSFPLYLEAEVDERMYTKRDVIIEGANCVVYTARQHLSFSQVYDEGKPIFSETQSNAIMEQLILRDSGIYVVTRPGDVNDHERFFMGRDDNEWQRANDEHPDYIIV